MKNDRYFKFLVATILAAVALALLNPGHARQSRPAAPSVATMHS